MPRAILDFGIDMSASFPKGHLKEKIQVYPKITVIDTPGSADFTAVSPSSAANFSGNTQTLVTDTLSITLDKSVPIRIEMARDVSSVYDELVLYAAEAPMAALDYIELNFLTAAYQGANSSNFQPYGDGTGTHALADFVLSDLNKLWAKMTANQVPGDRRRILAGRGLNARVKDINNIQAANTFGSTSVIQGGVAPTVMGFEWIEYNHMPAEKGIAGSLHERFKGFAFAIPTVAEFIGPVPVGSGSLANDFYLRFRWGHVVLESGKYLWQLNDNNAHDATLNA